MSADKETGQIPEVLQRKTTTHGSGERREEEKKRAPRSREEQGLSKDSFINRKSLRLLIAPRRSGPSAKKTGQPDRSFQNRRQETLSRQGPEEANGKTLQ